MRHTLVQDLILDALEKTLDQKRPADQILDKILRKNRHISSSERAAVARRFLGVVCLHARLDYLLLAVPQAVTHPHRFRLAGYLVSEEHCSLEEASQASGIDPRLLQPLQAAPSWPSDPVQHLAAQRSLPHWLARRWLRQFDYREADALAESMNRPGPLTVRVNLLKNTREDALAKMAQEGIHATKTSYSPVGLHLLGRPNIFGSLAWRQGLFEVQDEGSQLIALLTDAQPGEKCVDFCAGSGGKTLALAAQMKDHGEIWALDVHAQRLANLKPRLVRAGVSEVRSLLLPLDGTLPECILNADRVLVDAPCSSVGTLRRSPDLRWNLTPEVFSQCASLQLSILLRACQCVRPGGLLIYSTCSIDPTENEKVASLFQSRRPSFKISPVEPVGLNGPTPGMRLLPHLHNTDGFYACAWRLQE